MTNYTHRIWTHVMAETMNMVAHDTYLQVLKEKPARWRRIALGYQLLTLFNRHRGERNHTTLRGHPRWLRLFWGWMGIPDWENFRFTYPETRTIRRFHRDASSGVWWCESHEQPHFVPLYMGAWHDSPSGINPRRYKKRALHAKIEKP